MVLWYNHDESEVSLLVRPIYIIPRDSGVLRARSTRVRSVREGSAVIQDLIDT